MSSIGGSNLPPNKFGRGQNYFFNRYKTRRKRNLKMGGFFYKKKPLPHTHSWQVEKMNRRIRTMCFFFPSFARKGPGYFARGCKVRTPTQRKEASR